MTARQRRAAWLEAANERRQREARTVSIASFVIFALAFGFGLGLTTVEGVTEVFPVMLTVVAFCALVLGVAAAGEA
jgi:hypothetical protein